MGAANSGGAATRSEPFGAPEPLTELNSIDDDTDPSVSRDGRHMMFATARVSGEFELWEASR